MRRLTPKQTMFIDKTIETLNPTEAVRQVYDLGSKKGKQLENTARAIASENLTKPNIRQKFDELLRGIDDKDILDKFGEILRAEDKRASLQAGIELLKLKDRYPATRTKVQGLFANIIDKD